MIKYLIKFVSEKQYAEDFANGLLFMHTAVYYRELEYITQTAGQGDAREGIIFPGVGMYKNSNMPIFCLYAVEESDIINNTVRIDEKVLSNFKCHEGYCIIVDFDDFEERMGKIDFDGYEVRFGEVLYGTVSLEDSGYLAKDKTLKNLFIKDSYFKYQSEYRLAVYRDISKVDCYCNIRRGSKPTYVNRQTAIYYVDGGYKDAPIIYIKNLPIEKGKCIIDLNKWCRQR